MFDKKPILREAYLKKREELDAGYKKISSRIVITHILSLLPAGKIVAGYHAMRGELDISILMQVLPQKGMTACLPVTVGKELPLIFRQWKKGDILQKGQYGEDVPMDTAPEVVPDILLVPLVAFDAKGNRLGYGGGYYDRTIAHLRKQNPKLITIGLAFSSQQAEKIPAKRHDKKLDVIITEMSVIKVA